jgi:hypothetical protein
MKRLLWPLAVVIVPAILGAAGLLIARAAPPAPTAPPGNTATLRPTASSSPAPTIVTPSGRPRATVTPRQPGRPRPHRTGPWAVVSAYYRDVESHKYAKAWALISPALGTEQTYQQFVAGYACTGTERPAKLSQSGDRVSFNLTVVNDCTGAAQYYTGTDTVRGGKIVAADVTRTG